MSTTAGMEQNNSQHHNMINTRNFCIIASVDAGKSSLSDTIMSIGGLIKESDVGIKRITDTLKAEQERGITIKSTGVSVDFILDGNNYRINMIDSPGHADFNQNTQSAIRITDGAFVLLDVIEGVQTQTITVLRQALQDRVRPVLVINKIDRLIFELQIPAEEVYLKILKMVSDVNKLIQDYQTDENRWFTTELTPANGSVIFTSAYHGWGFDIPTLANLYNPEKGEEMAQYMWGDYFMDSETNRIMRTGTESNRIFCQFVYNPIKQMVEYLTNPNVDSVPKNYRRHFKKLGYDIDEKEGVTRSKDLYKDVFKKIFNLSSTLKKLIAHKLPSPIEAQHYRADVLYSGPHDKSDEVYRAIKTCDPDGPLTFYVTLMVPTGEGGRFYAFGRVFSGTMKQGQKVTILDTNYEYGGKKDIYTNKSIQRVIQFVGAKVESLDFGAVAGSIAAAQGIDNVMSKSGTITNLDYCHPIKTIKFTVSPVVQVSVRPKNMSELGKLSDGMKRLSKSDPVVKTEITEAGEFVVGCTGDLHMELILDDLRRFSGIEIVVGQPIVPLRESISEDTGIVCLKKSANKHNRLYLKATPLPEDLIKDLESGEYSTKDMQKLTKLLVEKYGWSKSEVLKIWGMAPYSNPSNMIVDRTVGLQYMHEIKDGVCSGFEAAVLQGIICGEQIRGVKFEITDVVLHADAIHRGAGQTLPMTRDCVFACMLANNPTIYEPIFEVTITSTPEKVGQVYSCISYKRGVVVEEQQLDGTPMVTIIGHLPVTESFGFDAYIKEQTSGQAFPSMIFSHWNKIDGKLRDDTILKTRMRKDPTKPNIPNLNDYLDKL